MARKFLTPVGLPTGTTLPATGAAGELFYLTTDSRVYQHNGTTWLPITPVPAGGAAGEFLTKVDGTDYSTTWTSSAPTAGYTSVVKHEVKLGEAIAKGQAVYVSSADGTNIIVSKASNATEGTSSKTMGLLETGGSTNAKVNVVTEGLLSGLDTSTATAGDAVWLGTAGNLIFGLASKPVAPAHLVYLGVVTRAHANQGEIFVHVQNGFELRELHTVLLEADASIADNEVLAYDSATSLWKNQTASEASLATSTHVHGNLTNAGLLSTSVATTNPVKVVITDSGSALGTLTTTGASNTTFLRGDGTWATPAGGGGGGGGISGFSGTGYSGVTSASSNSIGTGSKTFSVASTGAFLVGDIVRIINNTSTNNHWMQGTITALTTNSSITVNVTSVGSGTGTYTSWLIGVTNITGTSATGIDNQISPSLNILSGSSTATSGAGTVVSGDIVIKTGTATSDLTGAGGVSNPGSVFIESGEAVYDSGNGGTNLGKVYVGTGNTGEVIIGRQTGVLGAQVVRIMPRSGSDTKTLSLADDGGSTFITLGANASAATIRFGVNSTASATYHNGKNFFWQPTPTAVTGGTTTTIAALQTFILTTTSTSGTITLPTFANMSTINSTSDTGFDWVLINTAASGSVTIAGNTSHTIVGSTSVAFGTSARFRSVYRGSSVVTYRIG